MLFLVPTIAVVAACALILPLIKSGDSPVARRRVRLNGSVFAVSALLLVLMAVGVSAAPQTAVPATQAAASTGLGAGLGYLGAALATGLSCLGAGIAVGNAAPAAIGAFSEDPKAFGKALIFVVLGEGVALYGLLISILIINKL